MYPRRGPFSPRLVTSPAALCRRAACLVRVDDDRIHRVTGTSAAAVGAAGWVGAAVAFQPPHHHLVGGGPVPTWRAKPASPMRSAASPRGRGTPHTADNSACNSCWRTFVALRAKTRLCSSRKAATKRGRGADGWGRWWGVATPRQHLGLLKLRNNC